MTDNFTNTISDLPNDMLLKIIQTITLDKDKKIAEYEKKNMYADGTM